MQNSRFNDIFNMRKNDCFHNLTPVRNISFDSSYFSSTRKGKGYSGEWIFTILFVTAKLANLTELSNLICESVASNFHKWVNFHKSVFTCLSSSKVGNRSSVECGLGVGGILLVEFVNEAILANLFCISRSSFCSLSLSYRLML